MSAGRILLAGILGGIAMFVWMSVAHMATPLGMIGIKEIPNEQPVLTAMTAAMGQSRGMYFFPGTGVPADAPMSEHRAAMATYQQVLDKNPSGILIYKPVGEKAEITGQLAHEFGFEVLESLLLAILLSMTTLRTFGGRLGFALIVGVIAAVTTNLSYWTWYGFPASYTHAAMFVELVKYGVAGCVIALLMKKGATTVSAATA